MSDQAYVRDEDAGHDDEHEWRSPGWDFVRTNAARVLATFFRMGDVAYLKLGFVFCVFMTSAESKRKTQILCNISLLLSPPSEWVGNTLHP